MLLGRAIRRFLGSAARTDAEMASRLGLHSTDLDTLDLVFSSPEPVTPNRVAQYLGLTSGAATGAIDRIEKAGYVRRVPNPNDRRGAIVEPLKGRAEEVLSIYHGFIGHYQRALETVPVEDVLAATRLLQALADSDDAVRRAQAPGKARRARGAAAVNGDTPTSQKRSQHGDAGNA